MALIWAGLNGCFKWPSFLELLLAQALLRWPSVPDFPGQYQFLMTCPGKNHSSPGMPICPIFGLVSWICPDTDKLQYFTVWILILTCWSPNTKGWTPYTQFALAMATIKWLELSFCFHLLNRWQPGSARMPLWRALPGCRCGRLCPDAAGELTTLP